MTNEEQLVKQQIEYYRERAAEYDEWFLRIGRYDRGERHRRQWFAEVEVVRKALESSKPGGSILELACGTGLWTKHLAPYATRLLAVDVSPEAIEINRQRVADDRVSYTALPHSRMLPKVLFVSDTLPHIGCYRDHSEYSVQFPFNCTFQLKWIKVLMASVELRFLFFREMS